MDSVHNDEESTNPTPANKESTISERGNDDASEDANEKSSSIQHVETSDNTKGLVTKNVHAIKGDDSDGKVPMTPKAIYRYADTLHELCWYGLILPSNFFLAR
jgi:hypothetical protein